MANTRYESLSVHPSGVPDAILELERQGHKALFVYPVQERIFVKMVLATPIISTVTRVDIIYLVGANEE